ncbi:MAG: GNAT family N-acetyltransferase [Actinomycetota bacterium]
MRPDEATRLRELRLAALKDSPDAFYTTFEEAQNYPGESWVASVQKAQRDEEAILVAVDDDRWVGMIGLFPDTAVAGALHIWGMWVDPGYRGRNLGGALLDAATEVAARTAATSVRLHVVMTNESATALYERRGFVPAGEPGPLRPGKDLTQIELAKDLR